MTKTKRLSTILLGAILALGVGAGLGASRVETGRAASETINYVFSSKEWKATPANWTSDKDGNIYTSNQGVQVTTGATGANATSPISYNGITSIVVSYCTNDSKGAGSIVVSSRPTANGTATQIGSTFSITKPSSGGTTLKNTTNFVPNGTTVDGYIQIKVNCTTNSIYINGISITYGMGGGGDPVAATDVNVTAAGGATTVGVGKTLQLSASVLPNPGADQTVTWSSSNNAFATVNSSSGLVTGVAEGSVTITAASSTPNVSGTILLGVEIGGSETPAGTTTVILPDHTKEETVEMTTATMLTADGGLKDATNASFISSVISTEKVFATPGGFKFGSSSVVGKWRFKTAETVTKIVVEFNKYGTDDSSTAKVISHDDSKNKTSDAIVDGTQVTIENISSNEFSIEGVKTSKGRFYVKSIEFTHGVPAPEKILTSISVTTQPTKTTYYVGDIFDGTGMVVKAYYDDESNGVITPVLPTAPLVSGQTSVEISYTFGGTTKTTTVPITVLANPVTSLVWSNPVTTFTEGATLTLGAGAITATYVNSNTASLTLNDVTIYVYSGAFNVGTATIITPATFLTIADHNGKNIRFGLGSLYSNAEVLTVNVAPFVPTTTYGGLANTATLVTDVANLAIGDKILIAAAGYDYVMSATQGNNNRAAVSATKSGNQITGVDSETMQIITLESGTKDNTFAFKVDGGYLYAASSSENHLKTQSTKDDNASFAITVSSSGVATATAQGTYTRNKLKFNTTNNPKLFSCYSSGQTDIAIYEMNAGDSGLNYDYLLDVLAGDYCGFDIEGLDLINTRYEAMTSIEKFHFNSEEINGKDGETYTGEEAYTAAMIRRSSLAALPLNNPFIDTFQQNEIVMIIVIISLIGVSVIGASLFVFKRKQNKNY